MERTIYHDFDIGRGGKGRIAMINGNMSYVHETVSPESNHLGIGVYHVYDSQAENNTSTCSLYGQKFNIMLSPNFDTQKPNDTEVTHEIYRTGTYKKVTVEYVGEQIKTIWDKNDTTKIIDFIYSTVNGKPQLSQVVANGNITSFQYDPTTGDLTKITYPNEDCTFFKFYNNLIVRIVSPSMSGVQFEYTKLSMAGQSFDVVAAISDITYLRSVTTESTVPSSLTSISTDPVVIDDRITFVYRPGNDAQNDFTKIRVTKVNKKLDMQTICYFTFYDSKLVWKGLILTAVYSTQDIKVGLEQEELKVNNETKYLIKYTRKDVTVSGKKLAQQEAVYTTPQGAWIKTQTQYEKDSDGYATNRVVYQETRKLYPRVIDGTELPVFEGGLFQPLNRYLVKKVWQDLRSDGQPNEIRIQESVAIDTTSSLDEPIETIQYTYTNNRPTRIWHLGKFVQILDYDSSGDLIGTTTYPDPEFDDKNVQFVPRVREEKTRDNLGRIIAENNGTNFFTSVDYHNNSLRPSCITDAGDSKTNYNFDVSNRLTTIANGNSLLDKGSIKYRVDYPTLLLSDDNLPSNIKQSVMFNYYTKSPDNRPSQIICFGDSLYANLTQKEYKNQDGKVLERSDFVTYPLSQKTEVINYQDITEVFYSEYSYGNLKRIQISATTKDSFKDFITNETTIFKQNINGEIISADSPSVATTITNSSATNEVEAEKIVLKNLNITQNYNYSKTDNTREVMLPTNKKEVAALDKLERITNITNAIGTTKYKYHTIQINNLDSATSLPHSITDKTGTATYIYTPCGMIASVTDGSFTASYEYDHLKRLTKEVNSIFGTTIYSYDATGNISSKTVNDTVIPYIYEQPNRLSRYGTDIIAYSSSRYNPNSYRGKACTWHRMSNLTEYGDIQYAYNANKLRISKTNGLDKTDYTWLGDKLLAETRKVLTAVCTPHTELGTTHSPFYTVNTKHMEEVNATICYIYGINGITGFTLNGTEFYYRKNIQGDVTHIYDEFGKLMAHYVYNAWGEHQMLVDEDGIGKINAIRYRSYYYDNETGFYYLKSRYYDPEVGRFISMDSIEYLEPGRINGLNLYAYCLNNPIMYSDPDGNSVILAMLFGFLIGFGAGFGLNAVSQGLTNGWNNINLGQAAFNGLIGGISSALMLSPLGWGTVGLLGTGLGFTQSVGNDLFDNGGNWSKINWGKAAMFGIINGAFMGLGKWATSASVIGDIAKNSTRMQTQFMQTWYSRGMNFLTNSIIPSGFNYLFGFWEI